MELMRDSLAKIKVPYGKRDKVLDDIAESGMAAIQVSLKSSGGKKVIYKYFHRLRVSLRRRIASIIPLDMEEPQS